MGEDDAKFQRGTESLANRSDMVVHEGHMGNVGPAYRLVPCWYGGWQYRDRLRILAGRRRPRSFVVEARVMPVYILVAVPPSLIGVAAVLAVIRADPKDLPAIIRALMRTGHSDDDSGKKPPSLPQP